MRQPESDTIRSSCYLVCGALPTPMSTASTLQTHRCDQRALGYRPSAPSNGVPRGQELGMSKFEFYIVVLSASVRADAFCTLVVTTRGDPGRGGRSSSSTSLHSCNPHPPTSSHRSSHPLPSSIYSIATRCSLTFSEQVSLGPALWLQCRLDPGNVREKVDSSFKEKKQVPNLSC